ncbi:hypothetical protein MferCBS49748_006245 [Microsporum ferrugineum]
MKAPLSKEIVSDSSSSESEEESRLTRQDKPKKSKKTIETTEKSSIPSSGESSRGSTGTEDEDSESASPAEPVPPPSSKKKVTIQEENTIAPLPSKAFKPPPGFQFMQKSSSQPSDISQLLSNLDGKQLWHITAPMGVPVSSIESLAVNAISGGEPVLTHKGTAYRLQENQLGVEKQKSLLIPGKDGNVYRRQRRPVSRTYRLEQVVSIPHGDNFHANGSVDISALTKRPPKQPQNLRMRYKPFGSADQLPETIGLSDSEPEPEDKQFKVPKGADIDRKHKKRKQDIEGDEEPASSARESPKKKQSLPIREDGEQKKQKKSKKSIEDRQKTDSPEAQKKNSKKKHRDETDEEQKVRKEEKRRKRQSEAM